MPATFTPIRAISRRRPRRDRPGLRDSDTLDEVTTADGRRFHVEPLDKAAGVTMPDEFEPRRLARRTRCLALSLPALGRLTTLRGHGLHLGTALTGPTLAPRGELASSDELADQRWVTAQELGCLTVSDPLTPGHENR